jgi:hypothetical protein
MKIIKSTETPTGNLSSAQKKFMYDLNLAPSFDQTDKPWSLECVLATDTHSVPWLIKVDGINFVAIQSPPPPRGVSQVNFYNSDEKGRYKIATKQLVKKLKFYVDLESACDEFTKQYFQEKLSDLGVDDYKTKVNQN